MPTARHPAGTPRPRSTPRLVVEQPEEAGAQTGLDRAEEHVLERHAAVDEPVRHRPRRRALTEPVAALSASA